jgi:hypothetical protein
MALEVSVIGKIPSGLPNLVMPSLDFQRQHQDQASVFFLQVHVPVAAFSLPEAREKRLKLSEWKEHDFLWAAACGRPIERDGGPLATIALGAPESGFEATVFCSEGALAKVRL